MRIPTSLIRKDNEPYFNEAKVVPDHTLRDVNPISVSVPGSPLVHQHPSPIGCGRDLPLRREVDYIKRKYRNVIDSVIDRVSTA
jgi:hypothetical protein